VRKLGTVHTNALRTNQPIHQDAGQAWSLDVAPDGATATVRGPAPARNHLVDRRSGHDRYRGLTLLERRRGRYPVRTAQSSASGWHAAAPFRAAKCLHTRRHEVRRGDINPPWPAETTPRRHRSNHGATEHCSKTTNDSSAIHNGWSVGGPPGDRTQNPRIKRAETETHRAAGQDRAGDVTRRPDLTAAGCRSPRSSASPARPSTRHLGKPLDVAPAAS
jgi:hypothetical protein